MIGEIAPWLSSILALTGLNFTAWVLIGCTRFIQEEVWPWLLQRFGPAVTPSPSLISIQPSHVAVIMAARNEAKALPATLAALCKNISPENIYIGSDASTDQTAAIARAAGCHVVELQPNRGKAGVLGHVLSHFRIFDHYQAVLIMDAEVVVSDNYLEQILPYFDDPKVVAFVAHCHSRWPDHWRLRWSLLVTAYRTRLWCMLYYGLRYGQTWRYTNATPIIPGGSSVYRTSALAQLEINTPGLIIEDFNFTFQIYHKRLGRVASHPRAFILDQEPYTVRDYYHQVYRWFLGFWQTCLHHGYWSSFFWWATFLFVVEMFFYSLFLLAVPLVAVWLLVSNTSAVWWPVLTLSSLAIGWTTITLPDLLVRLLLVDYGITCIMSVVLGQPTMLIYGLGFFWLRYIDAWLFIWTLPRALFTVSEGRWLSPMRHEVSPPSPSSVQENPSK